MATVEFPPIWDCWTTKGGICQPPKPQPSHSSVQLMKLPIDLLVKCLSCLKCAHPLEHLHSAHVTSHGSCCVMQTNVCFSRMFCLANLLRTQQPCCRKGMASPNDRPLCIWLGAKFGVHWILQQKQRMRQMSGSLLQAHLFCIRWLSMLNNKSRAKQIILGLCEQKTEWNNLKLSRLLSQTFLVASKCVKNQSIRHENSARKNKFCCVSLSLCLEAQLAEDQERQRILLGSL